MASKTQIQDALRAMEREEEIRILLAVESGSRAWGFESANSDYDVRFIYVRPPSWYLSIKPRRDVVERPLMGDLDFSGWDLPKALELFRKSNPPLLEWLQSPVTYLEDEIFTGKIRALMPDYFSPVASRHHYLNMAANTVKAHLLGETVCLKKYFYALRPMLACLWIERGMGVVPMEFSKLLRVIADNAPLVRAIENLQEQKRAGCELDNAPKIKIISEFLETHLTRITAAHEPPAFTRDTQPLDDLFIATLVRVYGNLIRKPRTIREEIYVSHDD